MILEELMNRAQKLLISSSISRSSIRREEQIFKEKEKKKKENIVSLFWILCKILQTAPKGRKTDIERCKTQVYLNQTHILWFLTSLDNCSLCFYFSFTKVADNILHGK